MNKIIRHLFALGLPLLPLAGMAVPFDPAVVPAEARWVVALDLDTLRSGKLGKELTDSLSVPLGNADVADLKLDPQKLLATVGSVTAYGTNFSQHEKEMDGVLILQGTANLRKLAEGYVAQATITTPDSVVQIKDLPFEAYSLHGEVVIGFPKEPIILVGRSRPQLVKALEVFRTHKGSLNGAATPLNALLPRTPNVFLLAASVVPAAEVVGAGNGPQARILQMANAASLSLGTDEKTTSAHLLLSASSEEMADKLQKIIQGVAAMVSLTETSDKELAEFLQSINVARDGNTVVLHLAYPSEGVLRLVRNLRTAADTPAHHGAGPGPGALEEDGNVIAQWTADQTIGQPTPTVEGLTTRTIEKVALKNGTQITITGRRNEGENARLDCVEILPSAGGQPLVFEAENMKLAHYRVEAVPFASRGKLIMVTAESGTARFEFPGIDGTYTIKVRYVDESDGKSTFTFSTKDPD